MERLRKGAAVGALTLALIMPLSAWQTGDTAYAAVEGESEAVSNAETDEDWSAITDEEAIDDNQIIYGPRYLAEGETPAIEKITGNVPEDYVLVGSNDFGRSYMNGRAKIEVCGANYKEDYPEELAAFAESSCASMKIAKMNMWQDTEFAEPKKAKVAGYDAIRYDYDVIQNDFMRDENGDFLTDEDGNNIKYEFERIKGRAYFFYSDLDAYYIIFEGYLADWDELLPDFDKYVKSIAIDGKTGGSGVSDMVIVIAALIIGLIFAAAVVFIAKKGRKPAKDSSKDG